MATSTVVAVLIVLLLVLMFSPAVVTWIHRTKDHAELHDPAWADEDRMREDMEMDMPVMPVWDVYTAPNEDGKVPTWAHIKVCHAIIFQYRGGS